MHHRSLVSLARVVAVAAVASLLPATIEGQGAWTLQRTADGQPDLQGIWTWATATPLERPKEFADKAFLTAEEAAQIEKKIARANSEETAPQAGLPGYYNQAWWDRGSKVVGDRRTSLIVDPPDGKIPWRPDALKKYEAANAGGFEGRLTADSWLDRSLWERCITHTGIPRLSLGYNNNLEIVQGPGYVAILYEQIHEPRIIPLDGRSHLNARVRQWLGDSRGRWEGDTLVVETTNFTDKTDFRGSSDKLHLVERFRRVAADTIDYQFTVTDPTVWTRPWTVALPLTTTEGPIYEYACHEGNESMVGILSGARAQENGAAPAQNK